MNEKPIVVLDLETSGLDCQVHEIIEVFAQAINPRTLKVMDEFHCVLKLMTPHVADEGALRANGFTFEEIEEKGSDPRIFWPEFVKWVNQFNKGKNNNPATAPIVAGKNVAFDLDFISSYNKKYLKKEVQLFARAPVLELEDYLFLWFENDPELTSVSMDSCRAYLGMSSNGAHRAKKDVLDTVKILTHFLKLHRELRAREIVQFKNSFRGDD